MNKAVLIGRLTKDPELRFTQSGKAVCSFTLAVDRQFKNKETGKKDVDFINIVIWNKLAEVVANNLTKGRLVAVSGRIQTRTYEGQDGQKKYITEIVADDCQFLDYKKQEKNTGDNQSAKYTGPDDTGHEEDFFPVNGEDPDIPF